MHDGPRLGAAGVARPVGGRTTLADATILEAVDLAADDHPNGDAATLTRLERNDVAVGCDERRHYDSTRVRRTGRT